MRFLFLFCILHGFTVLHAQPQGGQRPQGGNFSAQPGITGKVSGILIDSTTSAVLEFATVAVKTKGNNKTINGGLTELDGSFKIINIPLGTYLIEASFVGYIPFRKEFTLTPKNPDVNLSKLKLQPDVKALSEVVIQGEREAIENRIDKLVYNAEMDAGNAGGDATDVLRRTPLLSVDVEGNVSLRGSQNIQILLNGKPTTMFASSPGDALRSIPADQIKNVEVITSPGAKYDGEGTAGIINIVTKKQNPEGFTGNVDLSLGNIQNRGSVNLSAGLGRFGINVNGSSNYSVPRTATSTFYREDGSSDVARILTESGEQETYRLGFFGTASAFYDVNAYNSFTSSFRLRGFESARDGNYLTNFSNQSINLFQEYDRYTNNESLFAGYEWSIDFIRKSAKKEGREISFSYKIDGNIQDSYSIIQQQDLLGDDPLLFRDQINTNDGNNREQTIQADYVHPITKTAKIEVGAKAILRDLTSDFSLDTLDRTTDQYLTQSDRSDKYTYNQDVLSGYVSTNFSLPYNIGVVAGTRVENTHIDGDFRDTPNPFENNYFNVLPSLTVNKKLNQFNSLKLSYTRRIQRPNLRQINPFVEIDNNRSISYGNPNLDPELTDQYELSYSTFKKGSTVNMAVYYRRTIDIIENYRFPTEDDVVENTFLNIGTNQSFGLNFFASITLFKIWTLRGNTNVFTYDAQGVVNGQTISNTALLWSGNMNSSVTLPKNLVFETFGFYRAPNQTIQGYNPNFSIISFALQKKIWNDRGRIGLRVVEPFKEKKPFGSELSGEGFYQKSRNNVPFRSFGINFSYKFGKMDYKERQRRTKINNNDQEQTGDNQSFRP